MNRRNFLYSLLGFFSIPLFGFKSPDKNGMSVSYSKVTGFTVLPEGTLVKYPTKIVEWFDKTELSGDDLSWKPFPVGKTVAVKLRKPEFGKVRS